MYTFNSRYKLFLVGLLIVLVVGIGVWYFISRDVDDILDNNLLNISIDSSFPIHSVDLLGISSPREVLVGSRWNISFDVKSSDQAAREDILFQQLKKLDVYFCFVDEEKEKKCELIADDASLTMDGLNAVVTIDENLPLNTQAYIKLTKADNENISDRSPNFTVVNSLKNSGGRATVRPSLITINGDRSTSFSLTFAVSAVGGAIYVSKEPSQSFEFTGDNSFKAKSIAMEYGSSGSTDRYFYIESDSGRIVDLLIESGEIIDSDFIKNKKMFLYYSDEPNNLRKFSVTINSDDFKILDTSKLNN